MVNKIADLCRKVVLPIHGAFRVGSMAAMQRLKTSNTTIGAKQPDLSARLLYDHLDCDPYVVYCK